LGWNILRSLKEKGIEVVVVDFNPDIIKKLEAVGVPAIYGEISDPEILEKASAKSAKMIISTVYEHENTLDLLSEIKKTGKDIPTIVTSPEIGQALEFYRLGAAYVIIPRILSSQLIEKFLTGSKFDSLADGSLRKEHIEELADHGKIFS
jgi:Trk K+ transport system NAD-binding subunit